MARIPYLTDETASPEARAVWAQFKEARGTDRIGHVYQLLAHSPELMARWGAMVDTLRDRDGAIALSFRHRELAILQTARVSRTDYEWASHLSVALREGVTSAQIDALLRDEPGPFPPDDRAVLAYAKELTADVQVPEATFVELKRHLNDRQIIELTVTVGYYNCLARFIGGLAQQLEPGQQGIPRV
jgi:alkylhydroperoxidase family enzyme